MRLQLSQLGFWRSRMLPVQLQTEASECGLACLSMIASYWGHVIDMPAMRRRCSVSLKGTTLKALMAMSEKLGLQSRPLKLDMDHLPQLRLPCIVHWDFNHFVVLKTVAAQSVIIHDPAVGIRRLQLAEFRKHFTGVAVELTPASGFRKERETENFSLRSLMGNVVGLKRGLFHLLGMGLALQVCSLIAPFYMQWTVDEALVAADRDLVTVLGIGFVMLVFVQTAITGVRAWATTVLATNLNLQWLGNAFAHLMKLPLEYFEKRHSGDVVSRFSSIQTIQHSITTQVVEGVIDGALVISTLFMMALYSSLLTSVACIAVILYTLLRYIMFRPLRNATAEQIMHAAKQQTHFLESVRGIQSVRLFGRAQERRAGWLNLLTDQFNAQLRVARFGVAYQTLNFFVFGLERVVVIWLAALAVLDAKFSIGMVFAFVSYKDQFSQRTTSLIDKLFELRMLRLHGERVADILFAVPESGDCDIEIPVENIEASVEIRDLTYRYAESEPFVIKGLNLSIPAGQCIAIVGPSGCGKTTLIKLLLGLLQPSAGEIRVGGATTNKIGMNSFRQMIGTVMQDDTLFAGSIADNISFFDPAPDQERVQMCALHAAVHAEILAMPMGYNTLVGDIGTGLSGGQKQRILLARALYRQPKILVLDEATSHLDIWNEQAVNESIRRLNLTRLIVAHRPETIAMAQRVVVLQHGAIVQDAMQATSNCTEGVQKVAPA